MERRAVDTVRTGHFLIISVLTSTINTTLLIYGLLPINMVRSSLSWPYTSYEIHINGGTRRTGETKSRQKIKIEMVCEISTCWNYNLNSRAIVVENLCRILGRQAR